MTAQLAEDLRHRRDGVLGDLLTTYGRDLQGVAYLILRNHADAEEIVMDTLVTAWQRASDLRDATALRTWLLRIATRRALSRRRGRHATQTIERAAMLQAPAAGQPSVDRVIVAEAINALPPQMRAAVALHHVAGMTVPQAAAVMGKSENTLKSQLREAMARLRAALEEPAISDSPRTQPDVRRA